MLAVFYTDLFRGVPTLLVVILAGFGVPALQLQGITNDTFWLGLVALVLSYGAYVAEVFRVRHRLDPPLAGRQRRRAGALARAGDAVRRAPAGDPARRYRRCSTTSSRCRRTPRCCRAIFVFEALFAAQDYAAYNFNYTPIVVVAVLFVALTIPLARFTDWLGRRMMRRERAGAR